MDGCTIDHLVVTAPSLEAGARYVQHLLGVPLQPGGAHARMGTHNLLLSLGEAVYLEVIAVDPAAAPPAGPRWFGLDACTPGDSPRLAAWVARSQRIEAAVAQAGEPLGPVESMRRGDLEWRITIPADGRPVLDGAAPALIEWPHGVHPARRLTDRGCRLRRLELLHPEPARVDALLTRLGLAGAVTVTALPPGAAGRLAATIDTPAGSRELAPTGDQRGPR